TKSPRYRDVSSRLEAAQRMGALLFFARVKGQPLSAAIMPGDDRRSDAGVLDALHVIAGLDESHGGPSYSVPRLCQALAATCTKTALLSVAEVDNVQGDTPNAGYRDLRFHWDYARLPVLHGLRCSSALAVALERAGGSAGVIHNHGLWLMPNLAAGWAAARAGTPLIVSPRGMLAPATLQFSRVKQRASWRLRQ